MTVHSLPGSGAPARHSDSLADVLERVLDKGVVIAGDVVVNVLDIELLTLKVRLLIASVDTAREMGIDWWTRDPFLAGQNDGDQQGQDRQGQDRQGQLAQENRDLRRRIEALERALGSGKDGGS